MFNRRIYSERRELLKSKLGAGLALFIGNDESPMNYSGNPYHFRQDSSFLYYFGHNVPGLTGVIDVDDGNDILFGDDMNMEDLIWMEKQPTTEEMANRVGVRSAKPNRQLVKYIKNAVGQGKKVRFLPTYRAKTDVQLSLLLGIPPEDVKKKASPELVQSVVDQRSVKIKEEIAEIERALDVTREMHTTAMQAAREGIFEYEICGAMEGVLGRHNLTPAFPIIFTVNGQVLHNHNHDNVLKNGRLVVNDSGAESELGYASDITRTFPVSGNFTQKQRDIYEVVLSAQEAGINAIKPGLKFRDIHLSAARIIVEGLISLDLMKGNPDDAVKEGAHALFFPHGLGHMMGLDVHDMEGLGEDHVGYDRETDRSKQFGLAYLRMAREMKPGFVMTVEPGIYFIPPLIDKWKSGNKFGQYINYDKISTYKDFGGIRIEDNVLVTEDGSRVLGKRIPKTVKEIESIVGKG